MVEKWKGGDEGRVIKDGGAGNGEREKVEMGVV